jgi:hypothetical protein
MRSPLSSRRNNLPDRVAPDEAFVLVVWRTVMVYPFVSQLRFGTQGAYAAIGGATFAKRESMVDERRKVWLTGHLSAISSSLSLCSSVRSPSR